MSDNKIKHLATWIAWVLIHIYILAFRFTLYSLAVLVVAAVYLLLTTVLSKKHEDGYVHDTMGNLLGTSLFVFLAWSIVTQILPEILAYADSMDVFWENKLELLVGNATAIFSYDSISIALIGSIVVFVIQCIVAKSIMLKTLFSYVYNVLWMNAVMKVVYDSKELSFMCILIVCIFAFVEAWSIRAYDMREKSGKRWLNILTILMFVVICWNPSFLGAFAEKGYLEYFFVVCTAKWYHLLFTLVVLGALAVTYGIFAFDKEDRMDMIDFFYALRAIAMVLLVFFLDKFHVGYWWVMVLIAVIFEIVNVLFIFPKDDDENRIYGGMFAQIAIAVVLIILTIAGHCGRFVMTLAVLAGIVAVLVALVYGTDEADDENWIPAAWMYTAIVAVVAVVAAISLWFYRNLGYNFWLLGALSLVTIGAIWLLSYNGSIVRSAWNIPQYVVMGIFVIGVGCLMFSHGSTIRFEQEEGQTPVITAEAKGEDNKVVSMEYYWTEDWIKRDNATFEIPEEKEIAGTFQIPEGEGKLRVVATDAHGIVTEEIFWIHMVPDYSEAS